MSKLQVNDIVDKDDVSAPGFSKGAVITGVCTATTFVGALTGNADTATTATSTSGNAGGLTGSPDIAVGQVTAGVSTFTGQVDVDSGHINLDAGYSLQWGDTHERIEQSDDKIEFFTGNGEKMVLSGSNLEFPDNGKVTFGTGSDLKISHDGTNSYIESDTGDLIIGAGNGTSVKLMPEGGEDGLTVTHNGAVEAYYDNSKKFETTTLGVTISGTISDDNGNVRALPYSSKSSAYTLVATDAGKVIYISTGGVTLPNSVMSGGDMITIVNNSGSDQTLTQDSGLTLYNTADASTGNRTLAGRGMATVWYHGGSLAYISGAGLS